MPKLTNQGLLLDDDWTLVEAHTLEDGEALPGERSLVPLDFFMRNEQRGLKMGWGIWLSPDDDVNALRDTAANLPVIAVSFPAFTDGRGFSQARILRDQLGYKGELRAVGSYIQDQLFYLKRCGFDAFIVDESADVESMRQSLQDFSDGYQAAVDQPTPLFRRRSA